MKYSALYPNMTTIDDEEGGIIRGRTAEPCSVCGELTEYIEICAEAHFCSEECVDQFYREFEAQCRTQYEEHVAQRLSVDGFSDDQIESILRET